MSSELITKGPFKGWYEVIPRNKIRIGKLIFPHGETDFQAKKEREEKLADHLKKLKEIKYDFQNC
jgi:hypothetical protein